MWPFKRHLTKYQARELFTEVKSQTHPNVADLKRLANYHKAPIGTLVDEIIRVSEKLNNAIKEQYNRKELK